MADLELLRLGALEHAALLQALEARRAEVGTALRAARSTLARARAMGDEAAELDAVATVERLLGTRAEIGAERARLHDVFGRDLGMLLGDQVDLEGDVPLVLLPVRVECRSTEDQAALRVRIFPDALHTEQLDEGVTDAERAAGEDYWRAVWADGDTMAPWPALVTAVGTLRAPWVAEALRPANLDERPGQPPAFPATTPAGQRHAVVRTLPDRLFVRVEQDGAPPLTVHGGYIPAELPVGLVEPDDLAAVQLDDHDLPPLDESLRWLVHYAEAERLGLAVTVRLPRPGAGVRRLTVYGVRATVEPAEGAARLERLVRSHRFTDGAEFVPQGTPTNNTDSARTDWSRRTPLGPPTLATPATLAPRSNAAATARALGVDPALLATLPHGTDAEQERAAAFHTALWTTTWAEAFETLSPAGRTNGEERLDHASIEAVRRHWEEHVRGRGPLPVMRFGRQPYGVLPVVMTDSTWKPLGRGFAERSLVPFLDASVRWMWEDAVDSVVTVLNTSLEEALPEILGTDAVLRALRVRSALSQDPTFTTATSLLLPDAAAGPARDQLTRTLLVLAGVEPESMEAGLLVGKRTSTLALPMVHHTDPEFVANLLEPVPAPMAAVSVLQVLLGLSHEVEEDHQRQLVGPEREWARPLFAAVDGSDVDVDRRLVMAALDSVLSEEPDEGLLREAGRHLDESVGRLDLGAVAARNPVAALAPRPLVQQVAGESVEVELLRHELGMQLVNELFHGRLRATRFREALRTISTVSDAEERRLLLSEVLDCCSHRLDAWLTSAASLRLKQLRDRRSTGVHLGAYGWLEDLELRTPVPAGKVDGRDVLSDTRDGGYVHAPGLTQAATAGVLRSGRLTHRRGDPSHEALELDLSSGRVRDALSLLDGMRQGQSLGALLGYRLERRLHDRSRAGLELDRFIYVLRALAPTRAGKLAEAEPSAAQEALAASEVVDGLRLLELSWATVEAALVAGPKDNVYVPDGTWVAPTQGERRAVQEAVEALEQTHDAVADLLLAEGVHQVVSGNPARAAAALDLLGAGEAAPVEPEVVRTPRSGTSIQHRVAVVVAQPPPPSARGWKKTAPRALAEPRLEAWAQAALSIPPDPGRCALDVLYDSDDDLAVQLRAVLTRGRALDLPGRPPLAGEVVGRARVAIDGLAAAADPAALASYGLTAPAPNPDVPLDADEEAAGRQALLLARDQRVLAARALLDRVATPGPDGTAQPLRAVAELAVQALAVVFGGGFLAVPLLGGPPSGEPDPWGEAVGPDGVGARPGADIRPWLARAGAFREGVAAYGETVLVREAVGARPTLRVAQTPVSAVATWVGLPFPDGVPPAGPVQSTVLEQVGGDLTGEVAGVVLDEWTEMVPKRLAVQDPAAPDDPPHLVDVTTTGVALNANAPGARPPQSILLAMTPDGGPWTSDRLVAVLDETLALARMRCVTLHQVPFAGMYLPALYFRDWSLQGEPVLDWLQVATEFHPDHATAFLQEEP